MVPRIRVIKTVDRRPPCERCPPAYAFVGPAEPAVFAALFCICGVEVFPGVLVIQTVYRAFERIG